MKFNKMMSLIAVAMMIMTALVVIDPMVADDSSAASDNGKPTVVTPTTITGTTKDGKLWDNCKEVVYEKATNTLTFSGANIEMTLGDTYPTLGIDCSVTTGLNIVLKGSNTIHFKYYGHQDTPAKATQGINVTNGTLAISGTTVDDSLTIGITYVGTSNPVYIALLTIINCKNLTINNCAMNFVLEKEESSVVPSLLGWISIYVDEGSMTCNNSSLKWSVADKVALNYYGIMISAYNTSSNTLKFTNSVLEMKDLKGVNNNASSFIRPVYNTNVEFKRCIFDVEMAVKLIDIGLGSFKFTNFKSIKLYEDPAGTPTVIKGSDTYTFDNYDWMKIDMDSDVNLPRSSQSGGFDYFTAIIAVIALIPVLFVIILILYNRDDKEEKR